MLTGCVMMKPYVQTHSNELFMLFLTTLQYFDIIDQYAVDVDLDGGHADVYVESLKLVLLLSKTSLMETYENAEFFEQKGYRVCIFYEPKVLEYRDRSLKIERAIREMQQAIDKRQRYEYQ